MLLVLAALVSSPDDERGFVVRDEGRPPVREISVVPVIKEPWNAARPR